MNAPQKKPAPFLGLVQGILATWPNAFARAAIAQGYRALRAHPHVVADIARRNYVMSAIPGELSEREAAICEGRRQLALEIMSLTKLNLDALLSLQR